MGFLSRLSALAAPARMRASADYSWNVWGGDPIPDLWLSALSAAGVRVTPDLAMTLSAFQSGVMMIAYDLATLPPVTYEARADGGKDRVPAKPKSLAYGGIGDLAYKLRWEPNTTQTSVEFLLSMLVQFLMRDIAYAEIVSPSGFIDQLLPRHPDRVTAERLSNGHLRYRLNEGSGGARYLTQEEMFVVRGLSFDGGVTVMSRIAYATQAIGSILAAEQAAGKFFKSGMTAAVVATYTGDMDDEDEDALHKSITRYATGVENSFGLMLIPDDVKISNLAIDPQKAMLMEAREWGVKEVARLLRIPGSKLGVPGTATYASAVQLAIDYVIGCLRPIAVLFEQAVQRDLITDKGTYFVEFTLDALMRGDPAARAAYFSLAIQNRWMRPSEVRLIENMNPDAKLDQLSESDHRPGSSGSGSAAPASGQPNGLNGRVLLHSFLAVHDNAVRCLKRERAAVVKIAAKHANDPAAWQAGLRDFYGEHAGFVANTMRLPLTIARGYAAEHGSALEAKGMPWWSDATEREEADILSGLAIDCGERAA